MLVLVLLILALICFLLATVGYPPGINLLALGLAFWVLSVIISQGSSGLLVR